MDVDEDESGSGSQSYYGSEPRRNKKSKGQRSGNRNDTNDHTNRNYPSERDTGEIIFRLGAYTDAASTAIQSMSTTQNAIENLANLYTAHIKDIEQINEIQQRSSDLEQQCRNKDEKIKDQDTTINTLWEKTHDHEKLIVEEKKKVDEERRVLEVDKKQVEKDRISAVKRLRMQEAEQEVKLQKKLEGREAELEERFRDREKELECNMQKREDENKHRLASLEEENSAHLKKLEKLEKDNEEYGAALTKAKDDYDDVARLRDSYKGDAYELKKRLKAMENEFSLNTKTTEF